MRLKLTSFLCLCLGLFCSCNNKVYTLSELPENQIVFGDGGGFAGTYQEFLLLENGQIFKSAKRGGNYEELESVNKKAAKAFFKQAAKLKLEERTKNEPGNMTYFIHYKSGDNKEAKVIWGANGPQIDTDIKMFYNELKKTVKDSKAKSFMSDEKEKQ